MINSLYEQKFKILIFTARYMGRNSDNIFKAKKEGYRFTKKQLKNWGIKYHKLIFGKPSFDLIIDDKNLNFNSNWHKDLKKN